MDATRSGTRTVLAVMAGIGIGWGFATFQVKPMHAVAGDRAGECIVTTGPVLQQYDEGSKGMIPLEAVYFLDYKGGRLLASVPTYQMAQGKSHVLEAFSERDLVADFRLDVEGGPQPRFLMTTGSLGRFSAGWAPLYVFETTSGQVAVYRIQVGQYGSNTAPRFELVELQRYGKRAAAPRR